MKNSLDDESCSADLRKEAMLGNVLSMIGRWLAETKAGSSQFIIEDYLVRGAKLLESNAASTIKERADAFYSLAVYADELLSASEDYMQSADYESAQRHREENRKELLQLQQLKPEMLDRDTQRRIHVSRF